MFIEENLLAVGRCRKIVNEQILSLLLLIGMFDFPKFPRTQLSTCHYVSPKLPIKIPNNNLLKKNSLIEPPFKHVYRRQRGTQPTKKGKLRQS